MGKGYEITLMGNQVYYEHVKNTEKSSCSIVLVHGFMASTFTFNKIFHLLAKNHEVYALDLVGFGKSEKGEKFHYSYSNYAQLIIEFIKKMELRNVVLMGHSMGGQIALHAARQSPEWIRALVLVGCCSYLEKANQMSILCSYIPFMDKWLDWWVRRFQVKDILKNTLYHDSLIDEEMIRAYEEPMKDKNFSYTLMGLLRDREGDLTPNELNLIKQPVLLIWGEEDRIVPIRIGLRLRQDLPHSHFISIPESGHQVIEEKPEEIMFELENWFSRIGLESKG